VAVAEGALVLKPPKTHFFPEFAVPSINTANGGFLKQSFKILELIPYYLSDSYVTTLNHSYFEY